MANQAILITGASGVIGSYLALYLDRKEYDFYGIDKNPPKVLNVWKQFVQADLALIDFAVLFRDIEFSHVLHLAGSSSVSFSFSFPEQDYSSLLPGTIHLLQWAILQQSPPRIIFFSSAAVYGNPQQLPIHESAFLAPISPYGLHKQLAEQAIIGLSRIYATRYSILRLFSVYGPSMSKQVVWDLYNKLKHASDHNSAVQLSGTGHETRDFIYIDDICLIVNQMLLSNPSSNEILNIASGAAISIGELANKMRAIMNLNVPIVFNSSPRLGDPTNWKADISQLARTNYLKTPTQICDGLQLFVNWCLSLHN